MGLPMNCGEKPKVSSIWQHWRSVMTMVMMTMRKNLPYGDLHRLQHLVSRTLKMTFRQAARRRNTSQMPSLTNVVRRALCGQILAPELVLQFDQGRNRLTERNLSLMLFTNSEELT